METCKKDLGADVNVSVLKKEITKNIWKQKIYHILEPDVKLKI